MALGTLLRAVDHLGPKEIPTSPYHILAPDSIADERTRVLKQGDTFLVCDHYGDIAPLGLGENGLYHNGTRFLSCLRLQLEGRRPFFLSSTVSDENDILSIELTNPDLVSDDRIRVPFGSLHLQIKRLLWNGVCYQQLLVKNYGLQAFRTFLSLAFFADYADIFEVRGMKRPARGEDLEPEVSPERVVLRYRGLDRVERHSVLAFHPRPAALDVSSAGLEMTLQPQEQVTFHISIGCECEPDSVVFLPFSKARQEAEADLERSKAWSCHVSTTNGQINAWLNRADSDLLMMTTQLQTGPYPYAGVPWFNTPFGRDGIITALESLWLRPRLARGVLAHLASMQATRDDPEQDAEPGKILHESRLGEMAALKEIPFGRYYGSVDATPLFVLLAGAYYERTADREFIESLWPCVVKALSWIEGAGDADGDGFIEYHRQSDKGLVHQGWKDSDDAVFHANGSSAKGPFALCEVQAYVYGAYQAAAQLARVLGEGDRASDLSEKAGKLRQRFEDAFWCEDISTYALALDGDKSPCRVRTSNAGQCLFTGIVSPERAAKLARTLLDADSYSGWGVRTVAAGEKRYNPMSYHNGSIWPHDNALIALGLARYGMVQQAQQIWSGMFAAGLYFDLHRMPELFCGFAHDVSEGPIMYPVACSPQAWAAASVFLMLQACLGLTIDATAGHVQFRQPRLPPSLNELRLHNLEVGGRLVDLLLVRHDNDVVLDVLRREGDLQVLLVR